MYNKSKIYAGCALSLALAMAVAPINVFAAESNKVNTETPTNASTGGNSTKINPAAETYADTDISVWGFTKEGIVYSVDVEWGAMTFEYEASSWDPDTHTAKDGAGWVVYDTATDKELGDAQDAINRVTVTNHSNAAVYAKLTYTGEAAYGVTSGTFAGIDTTKQTETEKSGDNPVEDFNASFAADTGVITLQTANNGTGGAAGTPTVGNVYFKPDKDSIDSAKKTANGIAQWTTIGKITVALSTTDPTAVPATPSGP